MRAGDYDFDVSAVGFMLGSTSAISSSYDGLSDDQADKLQAELEAREARRIPIGFRETAPPRQQRGARRLGTWPKVRRFDVL